jgi:hypothetical protein
MTTISEPGKSKVSKDFGRECEDGMAIATDVLGQEGNMDIQEVPMNGEARKKRKYSPRVWDAVRLNNKKCVNWTMAAGVVTMLSVSAAAWIGVAALVSRLVR